MMSHLLPHTKALHPTYNQGYSACTLMLNQLTNKLEETISFVQEKDIDITAISETLPKNAFHTPTFVIPGFDSFPDNRGRGVCIFVKKSYEATKIDKLNAIFSPSMFLNIKLSKDNHFTFGSIYRSPNCSSEENDNLCTQIQQVSKLFHDLNHKFVIVGDFNFPEIYWETASCANKPEHRASMFLNVLHENYIHQHITEPTHHRALQTPTLIDLVLTNDQHFVHSCEHFPPLGKSHHAVLTFSINMTPETVSGSSITKLLVDKGDYDSFSKEIKDVDWDAIFTGDSSVDHCWAHIYDLLLSGIDKYIPKKVCKSTNKPKHKSPSTPGLLHKVRLKRRAYKHYKKYRTQANYDKYAKLRNQVRWESRKAVRNKEKHIAKLAKTNPKAFFQYVSSKTTVREPIANLVDAEGNLTTSEQEKAEVLKDFFSSVFTREPGDFVPDFSTTSNAVINTVEITVTSMLKKLQALNPCKSPGPDGLHPKILKELAPTLAYPLSLLFIKSKIPLLGRTKK